ncbi:cache domain-containing protein [Phormidium sp. CCY1219]|uniref:cache domain-containing protein n=1 Tax=Phormidium sp. CCY1219 TaxID=2886104 RepID=UPI002D1E93C9|nr:cache domain-containing protein [Phormidium sp. CCY1219]MEB3828865.1 cyclic nucleotide-binding domain-containing protein [Phormidium sp. CCY1219]
MVSIRKIVPTVIVLPIVVSVGLTGWLSFRSTQQSVNELVTRLGEEISDRVETEVKSYVTAPHLFHQMTLASVGAGELNLDNFTELQPYFWYHSTITDSWDYIYYANQQGDILGVQNDANSKSLLVIKDPTTAQVRETYELNDRGDRLGLISQSPSDPRVRPWYQKAVEVGEPTWSSVYFDVFNSVLTITAITPVYQNGNQLQGVLAVDISLTHLSEWLRELTISPTAEVFIVDRAGEIVATSAAEDPFVMENDEPQRRAAIASTNPIIQATAQEVMERFSSFEGINRETTLKFNLDGKSQLVIVNPIEDERRLDWWIVAVVPEADFMGPVQAQTRVTIILLAIALVVAIFLGIAIARWLIRPILRLSAAAQDIEAEHFKPENLADVTRRNDEVGQLARVFQDMASRIYAREQGMKQQLQQLKSESDKAKKAIMLSQLTESDYLQELLVRSRKARSKADKYQHINLADLLRKVSYFQNFSDAEIQKLIDLGYRKILYPLEFVCREDEPGDAFYIILEGTVEIYVEKIDKFLTKLGSGAFFGELSLLLGIPRTATVRTCEDTVLFVLDREGLQKLLRNYQDMAEQIAEALHEHKAELESRKELLQKMGLLDDEDSFDRNPMTWIKNRMATLFGLQSTHS